MLHLQPSTAIPFEYGIDFCPKQHERAKAVVSPVWLWVGSLTGCQDASGGGCGCLSKKFKKTCCGSVCVLKTLLAPTTFQLFFDTPRDRQQSPSSISLRLGAAAKNSFESEHPDTHCQHSHPAWGLISLPCLRGDPTPFHSFQDNTKSQKQPTNGNSLPFLFKPESPTLL